jgi:tetratricopeptide (TPR) repeat protein
VREPLVDISRECLGEEVIAAFIDRQLTRNERKSATEHLARCEFCCSLLAETARMQPTETGVQDEPAIDDWWTRWKIVVYPAAALASAAVFILALAIPLTKSGSGRPELASLVAAVGNVRPFEARLTGGFAFGPIQSPNRSGVGQEIPADIRIAAAELESKSRAEPTPQLLGALGVADLIIGRSREALTNLERAVTQAPDDARLLSDLSAAYLVSAEGDGHADDLAKALASAERATAHDPLLKEAWFNHALAFERLHANQKARDAWNEYLKVDSTSRWAAEARQRLAALQ